MAADVWVAHWNAENIDVYVMGDTIRDGSTTTGAYFKVATKMVRDGELVEVLDWSYSKYSSDNWRYRTGKMRNNTSVVTYRDKIFEYCMHRLGWTYRVRDNMWYN